MEIIENKKIIFKNTFLVFLFSFIFCVFFINSNVFAVSEDNSYSDFWNSGYTVTFSGSTSELDSFSFYDYCYIVTKNIDGIDKLYIYTSKDKLYYLNRNGEDVLCCSSSVGSFVERGYIACIYSSDYSINNDLKRIIFNEFTFSYKYNGRPCYNSSDVIKFSNGSPIYCSDDVLLADWSESTIRFTDEVVFQKTPQRVLVPIMKEAPLVEVIKEVLEILPVILMTIVGLISLRKGLQLLSKVLHNS